MTFAPGMAVEMNFNVLDDWRREASHGSSVSWLRTYDPIRLTVSAFRPAAANLLLQPEAWSTFTPYLRDARAESLSVLCDDDSQMNPQMLRLMGWRTRVYECEFSVPGPASQRIRQAVTACSDGQTAYVFTFEGPPRAVLSSHAEFERILLSLDALRK